MSLDESLISYAVRYKNGMTELQQAGISREHFVDEYQSVWRYLIRSKRDHDALPSQDTLVARFPNLNLPVIRKREVPILVSDVKKRTRYIQFLGALNDAIGDANSYDSVDDSIHGLLGSLNTISASGTGTAHLVDLFSKEAGERIREELMKRKAGGFVGIPTGLTKFDSVIGGLQPSKMYTVIGRPGKGKSWLDLLFVIMAVMDGHKFILYPLEMTLYDTAARLYSILSQRMFGMSKVLKNNDITHGTVSDKALTRFLRVVEEKFEGKLLVADMASMHDPYTLERIEAEVELNKPAGFWIDYITLLKPPGNNRNVDEWGAVKQLSTGIKGIATRRNCVGGVSAQVNREAIKGTAFLPRLENIAYGDSIGQDTDVCISLNRSEDGKYLFYAVVKNRGGPEYGKTRCTFDVNLGHIVEQAGDDDE